MNLGLGAAHTPRLILLVFLALSGATPAGAQWSIAGFLGNAWNLSGDLEVSSPAAATQVTVHGVEYRDESFRLPVYYGARVTRFLRAPTWLGIEGEFVHLKTITRPSQVVLGRGQLAGRAVGGALPLGDVLPAFEFSHGLNFVLANVVVRAPLGRDSSGKVQRVALTARAGVGPTLPHVEARVQDQETYAYQWSSAGWQAAGGVEVRLTRSLLAVSEVKWTSTRQRVTVGNAEVEGTFRARQLIAGLAWALPTPNEPIAAPPRASTPAVQAAPAPPLPSPPTAPSVASLILDLPGDLKRIPSVETAVILGAAGTASLAVRGRDADITAVVSRQLGSSDAFDVGRVVGDLPVQAGAAIAVFASGRLSDNIPLATLGADLVRAQILNTVATHATKALVDRRRPDGARGSFPSGHASATFATAAVLQRHFGWKAGLPAYGLAVYTGSSRMAANSHYLSDVVFGAAMGIVFGRSVSVGRGRATATASVVPLDRGLAVWLRAHPSGGGR